MSTLCASCRENIKGRTKKAKRGGVNRTRDAITRLDEKAEKRTKSTYSCICHSYRLTFTHCGFCCLIMWDCVSYAIPFLSFYFFICVRRYIVLPLPGERRQRVCLVSETAHSENSRCGLSTRTEVPCVQNGVRSFMET